MSEPSTEDIRISELVGGRLSPWQVKRARKGGRAPLLPLRPADELKHWQLVAEVDGPGNDPQVVLVELAEKGFPAQGSGAAIRQLYAASGSDEPLEESERSDYLRGRPAYGLLLQMGQRSIGSDDYEHFEDEVALAEYHELGRRFAAEKAALPAIAVEEFGAEIYDAFDSGVGAGLEAALLSRSDKELAFDVQRAAPFAEAFIRAAGLNPNQGERAMYISQFTVAWPVMLKTLETTLKVGFDLPGIDPHALRELLNTTRPDELVDDLVFREILANATADELFDDATFDGAIDEVMEACEAVTETRNPELPTVTPSLPTQRPS